MHYLTRFCETDSERIRSIVDMHWGLIQDWIPLIASLATRFQK